MLLVCSVRISENDQFPLYSLEFLDIVQSQPLPDIPSENPALFHSNKTGSSSEEEEDRMREFLFDCRPRSISTRLV